MRLVWQHSVEAGALIRVCQIMTTKYPFPPHASALSSGDVVQPYRSFTDLADLCSSTNHGADSPHR